MAYFEKHAGHVRLHRLWAFATMQGELAFPEHIHLMECEECRRALEKCLEAENFGSLLKLLKRTDDRKQDDDSKAG